MHIEYLDYFLDVANTLSFSESAKRFYLTPQGLSRAVKILEKEMKLELFDRNGNNISLSVAGVALRDSIEKVSHAYEQLLSEAMGLSVMDDTKRRTEITIYATPLILNYISGMFSRMLNSSFPNIRIRLLENTNEQMLKMAYAPKNDHLYLVSMPAYSIDEVLSRNDIVFQPILNLKLMVKVGKNTVFSKKKIYTKQELIELPIAHCNELLAEEVICALLEDTEPKNIVLKTSNMDLLKQTVLEGRAITFTTDFSLDAERSTHRFAYLPIENTIEVYVGSIYKKDVLPEVLEVAHLIRRYLKQIGPSAGSDCEGIG